MTIETTIKYIADINFAYILSSLSLIVSLLVYKKSKKNESENKLIKSNQLSLEAWDILGGKTGTFRIKEAPTQENMIIAKRKIDEALIICPESTKANSVLSTYYSFSNQHEASKEVLEKLLKMNPLNAVTLYNLGDTHTKLNRFDEAVDAYKRSISCDPTRDASHHNLAHTFILMEKTDEAIQEFEASIALKPELVDSHHDLALLYSDIGEHQKSIDVLMSSLSSVTDDLGKSKIYNLLGVQYNFISEFIKAIEALETAVVLDPKSVAAHENLARAYHHEGRYSDAKDEFLFSKRLEPTNLQHCFNLGQVYLKLNMINESKKEFEIIYKREPLYPEIKDKIESFKKYPEEGSK